AARARRRRRGRPARLRLARGGPDVDVALGRVAVDLRELVGGEVEPLERADVLLELLDAARPDESRGDALVAEHPRERHLGERLSAPRRDVAQRADLRERVVGEKAPRERAVEAGA